MCEDEDADMAQPDVTGKPSRQGPQQASMQWVMWDV